jgi:hypothetical protein
LIELLEGQAEKSDSTSRLLLIAEGDLAEGIVIAPPTSSISIAPAQ